MPTSMPSPSASADLGSSPDLSSSPGAGGAGGAGSGSIPDFKEGTEVEEDNVPEIVKAVQDEYDGAKIVSIKHAMQENLQVYAVEIEMQGSTQTVYVQADGTLLESGQGQGGGTGGSGGGSGSGGSGGTGGGSGS